MSGMSPLATKILIKKKMSTSKIIKATPLCLNDFLFFKLNFYHKVSKYLNTYIMYIFV